MTYKYTRLPAPDPAQAARERQFVRARLRADTPMFADAVDSVVSADIPLEQAVRNLRESRNRVRAARNARSRSSRSAR
jgi:hypothetical protein